jgi:hypothetical protein
MKFSKLVSKMFLVVGLTLSASANAEEIFRIEVGRDYNRYSQRDLQRRVWELERAVSQLQARVFELELSRLKAPSPTPAPLETWLCKISAMGVTYTGTGATRAIAEHKVMETCKEKADDFFCKNPTCAQ